MRTVTVGIYPIGEDCGVAVVYGIGNAHKIAHELRHRGPDTEGYGIRNDKGILVVKGWAGSFEERTLRSLLEPADGKPIIVHRRYLTYGSRDLESVLFAAHPHTIGGTVYPHLDAGYIQIIGATRAMVHNGTIDSAFLQEYKFPTQTGSDTEQLLYADTLNGPEWVLRNAPNTYCIATLDAHKEYAAVYRDRNGRMPLWLGLDKDGNYIICSEDHPMTEIGGTPIREIQPGEKVRIYRNQIESQQVVPSEPKLCYFQGNYFARRGSYLWEQLKERDKRVAELRFMEGQQLAIEFPPDGSTHFATYLPNAAMDAGKGYSKATGMPYRGLFIKLKDDRAFQQLDEAKRRETIERVLVLNDRMDPRIDGTSYDMVEDSVIGLVNAPIAKRKAEERGFRIRRANIYTPPVGGIEDGVKLGCRHGVDMPPGDPRFVTLKVGRDPEAISKYWGVQTNFISLDGMLKVFEKVGIERKNLCIECISCRGA